MISAKKLLYKVVQKIGSMDSNMWSTIYPVGSYYETSDTTFDPNVSWGGTWSLEAEGLVHIGAGSNYTAGDTGGSETVTLDTTQIPSHSHGANADSNYKFVVTPANMYVQNDKRLAPTDNSGRYYMMTDSVTHPVSLPSTTQPVGGGQSHNNMQPYIVVNRWHRTA